MNKRPPLHLFGHVAKADWSQDQQGLLRWLSQARSLVMVLTDNGEEQ